MLTNGAIGHGCLLLPLKLCKRYLSLYIPTGNCPLAATPQTVKRQPVQRLQKVKTS